MPEKSAETGAVPRPPYQRLLVTPVTPEGGAPDPEADDAAPEADEARHQPVWALGALTLLEQWQRMLRAEPGVRAGRNIEDVHKMRVATRRLRAAAQVFGPSIDAAAGAPVVQPLVDSARQIAAALGQVRDLDVFIAYLDRCAQDATPGDAEALLALRDRRATERREARARLIEALDGDAMAHLKREAAASLARVSRGHGVPNGDPRPIRVHKRDRAGRVAPRLVASRLRRLRRLVRQQVAPGEAELHRVRIEAKKLRYLTEFLSTAYPTTLAPLAELATAIQDALGQVHDLHVFDTVLLGDLEALSDTSSVFAGSGAVARLLLRNQSDRDVALARFRDLWATLPAPRQVRRDMKDERRAWKHSR